MIEILQEVQQKYVPVQEVVADCEETATQDIWQSLWTHTKSRGLARFPPTLPGVYTNVEYL